MNQERRNNLNEQKKEILAILSVAARVLEASKDDGIASPQTMAATPPLFQRLNEINAKLGEEQ